MSLLDVAREEERRRRGGLPPVPVSPRPAGGWLRRSGHHWKVRAAQWIGVSPVLLLLVWFVGVRAYPGKQEPRWLVSLFTAGMLSTVPTAIAAFSLRASVRCRVCGLRLGSCAEARRLRLHKWLWVQTLEACPVCGDDGAASEAGRARWIASGSVSEPVYWSRQRVLAALMITAAMVAAFFWYVLHLKA